MSTFSKIRRPALRIIAQHFKAGKIKRHVNCSGLWCVPLGNPSCNSRPSSGRKGVQTNKGERLLWIVSVLHQNEGGIGKSIPDAQEISGDPRDFPREILRVEGNLEGGGDGFPNTSRVLVEYGHSPHHQFIYRDGSGNPSLWAGKD